MTTTIATTEPKTARDPLRVLSIAANLLPVEITDARRAHKLRWIVAAGLVVVLAALGFWDYAARQQTSDQQSALTKTQDQVSNLKAQINQPQYAAVGKVKAQDALISSELTKLMARDVAWYQVVPALQSTAKTAGVSLTNIAATLSTASSAASATVTANGTAATEAGTITLTGTAPDKTQVAAFLDALAKTPGLTNPVLSNLSSQSTQYQFSASVTFTSSLFSGRFTPSTSNGGK